MVKKRNARTSTNTGTVDDFINAAPEGEPANPLLNESPTAPRKYKSIALQFNKYEFDRLEVAANKSGISKNALIRQALESAYKKIK